MADIMVPARSRQNGEAKEMWKPTNHLRISRTSWWSRGKLQQQWERAHYGHEEFDFEWRDVPHVTCSRDETAGDKQSSALAFLKSLVPSRRHS